MFFWLQNEYTFVVEKLENAIPPKKKQNPPEITVTNILTYFLSVSMAKTFKTKLKQYKKNQSLEYCYILKLIHWYFLILSKNLQKYHFSCRYSVSLHVGVPACKHLNYFPSMKKNVINISA